MKMAKKTAEKPSGKKPAKPAKPAPSKPKGKSKGKPIPTP
jgi:hypothetical protein